MLVCRYTPIFVCLVLSFRGREQQKRPSCCQLQSVPWGCSILALCCGLLLSAEHGGWPSRSSGVCIPALVVCLYQVMLGGSSQMMGLGNTLFVLRRTKQPIHRYGFHIQHSNSTACRPTSVSKRTMYHLRQSVETNPSSQGVNTPQDGDSYAHGRGHECCLTVEQDISHVRVIRNFTGSQKFHSFSQAIPS